MRTSSSFWPVMEFGMCSAMRRSCSKWWVQFGVLVCLSTTIQNTVWMSVGTTCLRRSVCAQSTKPLTWLLTLSSGSRLSQKKVGVSKNRDTPKSSILIGFSPINHPFWGTTIFGNTQVSYLPNSCKTPSYKIYPNSCRFVPSQMGSKDWFLGFGGLIFSGQIYNPKRSIPWFVQRPRRAFELGSDDNLTAVVIAWNAEDKAWRQSHPQLCIAVCQLLPRPKWKRSPVLISSSEKANVWKITSQKDAKHIPKAQHGSKNQRHIRMHRRSLHRCHRMFGMC